ncbi:NADH dehydrogenase [Sphaerisporangium krabiense]|uniref:NADH-quinone oxidoreductase subunit L n=1 Tax=Sphaerisporangium krabiense TaxID=763782 RepID=A0A7W8Z0T5_9ACTN|nr:NADH-quinone oxidoreductase subunit L [Sphaerisporangium krabiense]MBB5625351.1 NADH-quinone oxidoreductase subunit L [Sphaerisporangium krabiense]GII64134.1 NADH dehydrogenase [Sphaerisporangium krabiense]
MIAPGAWTPVAVVLLPFLAAAAGLLLTRRPWRATPPGAVDRHAYWRASLIATLPTAISMVLAVWLFAYVWHYAPPAVTPPGASAWNDRTCVITATLPFTVDTGGIPITVGLRVDPLAALLAVLVTVVALAVQIYSVGYMRDEPRYPSYSAFISLFTSAMLLVVHAGDLLILYVGWEVMGLCSYLLIGHWWEDRANSRAAVKAFLVTRLGDVGFLFGLFTLGVAAGSFRVDEVIARAPYLPTPVLVAATMLILLGVAGKSAQAPLHTWLPDAMAGPTPISALIHAATMVAAGIFVVARLFPAFLPARPTLDLLAVIASLGMLGAALAALAQDDLKRVLAYSTISQLAYMAGGLAAGSDLTAIFHLVTHGAFKALLFLCAGAVIHAVGSNLMSDMGGLRRSMTITFPAMTIGLAALAGLPPTSGFFSKDAVLAAIEHSTGGHVLTDAAAWLLYGCALLTVAVTGAYATRLWLRTFFGASRVHNVGLPEPEPGVAHVYDGREAPPSMLLPIGALAVPALLLGFGGTELLEWPSAVTSVLVALLGAGVVYAAWRADPAADPARVLGPLRAPCEAAFHVDAVYRRLFVTPVLWLAGVVARADDTVVDGAVRGSGRLTLAASGALRRVQTGNAQLYLTGVLTGVLILVVAAVVLG